MISSLTIRPFPDTPLPDILDTPILAPAAAEPVVDPAAEPQPAVDRPKEDACDDEDEILEVFGMHTQTEANDMDAWLAFALGAFCGVTLSTAALLIVKCLKPVPCFVKPA